MKVLILGAGGLTGRYLVREAKRRGMEVAAYTRQELDIAQSDAARETLAKGKPALVINAASVTSLETCEENPVLSRKVNAEAPEEWAKECGRAGVRFVHLGTDYIFDGKKSSAYLPTDPASPLSRYGKDKAEGEKRVLQANPHALIVRLAWVYGHGGKTFMSRLPGILAEREMVELAGGRTGSCTYAGEAARIILDLAEKGAEGIFHGVQAGTVTWKEFAEKASRMMTARGGKVACREIRELPQDRIAGLKVPRPAHSPLDISATERFLGRKIPGWEEGLGEYLKEIGC
ncbi:MAG: dTDP-4-dehydrorhamnose reductase [Verrucomicrobia bacterium]|nr:dTDP-4-dehydrorhamnose reductase [Verrucomicrobiota bacterium]